MGGAVGGLVGGFISGSGAEDAAETAQEGTVRAAEISAEVSREAIDEQRRQFDAIQGFQGPFRGVGYNALYAMSDMMGLPRRFGSQDFFTDFSDRSQQLDPGEGAGGGNAQAQADLDDILSNVQWETPKNSRTRALFEEMTFLVNPDTQDLVGIGRLPGQSREDAVADFRDIALQSSSTRDFFNRLTEVSTPDNNFGEGEYAFGTGGRFRIQPISDLDRGRRASNLTGIDDFFSSYTPGGGIGGDGTAPVTDQSGVPLSGNALTGTPPPVQQVPGIQQASQGIAQNVMQNTSGSTIGGAIAPNQANDGGFF